MLVFPRIAALAFFLAGGAHSCDAHGVNGTPLTLVPEGMLSDLPEWIQPFCVWPGERAAEPGGIDPDDLKAAVENSVGWIRAVMKDEHIPDDLADRIVGVTDDIRGRDTTRVTYETSAYRFMVTQTPSHIVVAMRPIENRTGAERYSPEMLPGYLSQMIDRVFRHSAAIKYISSTVVETPFGVGMRVDESLRKEPSRETIERNLRTLDPTLPKYLRAGPFHFWWGQARIMTDGGVVILTARKGNGGGAMFDLVRDWFRSEKLPEFRPGRRAPHPPREGRSAGEARRTRDNTSP